MTLIRQGIAFIKLGRFLFLAGGLLFYALGAAIARYLGGEINWTLYIWGQVIVTSTQMMVHYGNDYFDYATDRANETATFWSGGSRVLPRGELSPRVALIAAVSLGGIALGATLLLAIVLRPALLVIVLLLAAIALGWSYSAPPLRLHAHGWGEITTVLIVPILTPLAGFCLQTSQIDGLLMLALLPLAPLQFAMLLGVHLPDVESDSRTDKQTLVVRLGHMRTTRLYQALLLAAYVILPLLVALGLPWMMAVTIFLPSPLAVWLMIRTRHGHWQNHRAWNVLIAASIALLMGTAFLETAMFLALT